MAIQEFEYKGCRVRIEQDELAEDPRKDHENFGTMVCKHRSYNLGDEEPDGEYNSWKELEDHLDSIGAEWLPIYMMDHSGLSLSTFDGMFRAFDPQKWDWGQLGVIYAEKGKILKEYGKKRMSKKIKEKALGILQAEVDEYNIWLQGGVVGFVIEDVEGEIVDSVWGYYDVKECRKEAVRAVEHLAAEILRELAEDRVLEVGSEVCA